MFSSKMNHKVALVLYLFMASVCSAPLQILPMQYGMQPQLPFLKHLYPTMQSPVMYPQQPVVIVLPNAAPITETDDRYVNLNEQANINLKSNTGHIDENKDAVVIESEPKLPETQPKNAIVYLPEEGRFSLGQIISYLPFIPIEVNVPDTIQWITSILTGGLFRPKGQASVGATKRIGTNAQNPIIVVPYPGIMPQV